MATFIHGIAASENIDSSGERISIAGMDISSLEKDGVFNWEHKADQPGQVVGKVLKARKIFSEQDCEDDHQLHFWQKCLVPYLYVMGELMDDFKESAKEVAGMFQYDLARQNDRNICNFSIEGAKIDKQGMDILKSIARKVTITVTPCNKAAVASMVPAEPRKKKGDINELFKTEGIEVEVFKKDEGFSMGTLAASEMKKDQPKLTVVGPGAPAPSAPKAPAAVPGPAVPHIGHTKSGKPVMATARVHEYKDFSEQDHKDAYQAHIDEREKQHKAGNFKQASMHNDKARLHFGAANTMASRVGGSMKPRTPGSMPATAPGVNAGPGPIMKSEIDSSLMTDEEADTLLNRTEDKYFISKTALDYLTQTIKENLKEGDIDTEVRYNTNRSIYLDNKDLDSLKDSMNGVKPRLKIRVRQYSPNSKDWEKIAYVELKLKTEDGTSNKLRVRIHADKIDSFVRGEPIECNEDLENINKDITKLILEKRVSHINHLVALYGFRRQIEVRYERRAYTNKDIRITVDENLRFIRSNLISDENILAVKCTGGWVNILQLDHQLKNEGYMILEVKHQGKIPGWVKKCLENCHAKEVKFSKYVAATACVIEAKQISGFVSPATINREAPEMSKALEAGSSLGVAPSSLVQGAALGKENLKKAGGVKAPADQSRINTGHGKIIAKPGPAPKPGFGRTIIKSEWLARAEKEYASWSKREEYENFMSRRLPHLTKGEIRAIGQVMALNKSLTLEKALSVMSGYEPLEKAGGKDSIYTLILFEGCDLHDILHCSHFATDAMNSDTYGKIKEVCDKYFAKGVEAKELEFKESGELGKESQKVLFLTEGDPYKDLFEQLDKAAPYKYSRFKPHISVTSNVDEFKGKAASLVISVNGKIKNKYDFK